MAITPRDVRNKNFSVGLRGYDSTDVREYLEEVAQELENLRQHQNELTSRLRGANDRLQTISKRESQVQELLDTAEKTIGDRMAIAKSKREAILAQAKVEAEEIVSRSRRERDEMMSDISGLQAQRERFRAEITAQLRSHADLLVRTGGGVAPLEAHDPYGTGAVAEILQGPAPSVDVDLGGGRSFDSAGGRAGRMSRRLRMRRASDQGDRAIGSADASGVAN